MPFQISSPNNPKIKEVAKLSKRNYRDRMRLTVVEGCREIGHALASGIVPQRAFVCHELLADECSDEYLALTELDSQRVTELIELPYELYRKLAYRESSGGLLLIIPYVETSLKQLATSDSSLVLVVVSPEKPGNLGALMRTADAAGFDAVIVCGTGTDVHNPNAIRSSLGALFTVPVAECSTAEAVAWLARNSFQAVAASPDAKQTFYTVDMSAATAILVGSEAFGLSDEMMAAADKQVTIPMRGRVDSLNLSTSAAILMYEAVRQRSQ